jgi:hypothetical protein
VFGPAWLQERKERMKYETVTEQDALLKGTPAQGGLHDINIICHLSFYNLLFLKISIPQNCLKFLQQCKVIIIPRMLNSS